MPDITMCASNNCGKRKQCYRHQDSGTVPDPYRQSYSIFQWAIVDRKFVCNSYWPIRKPKRRK